MKCPDCFNGMRPALFAGPDYPCTTPGCVGGVIRNRPKVAESPVMRTDSATYGRTLGEAIHREVEARLGPGPIRNTPANRAKLVNATKAALDRHTSGPMTLLEEGVYTGTVKAVRQRTSKTGRPILTLDFDVDGYPDTKVSRYLDMSVGYGVKETVVACGLDPERFHVDDMPGKRVQLALAVSGRRHDTPFNVVRTVLPPER